MGLDRHAFARGDDMELFFIYRAPRSRGWGTRSDEKNGVVTRWSLEGA